MRRTRAIFEHVFSLDTPEKKPPFLMEFISAADAGMSSEILTSRQKREAKSYETWETKTKHEIQNMTALHDFVFRKHGAYASKRYRVDDKVGEKTDKVAAGSY